MLVSCLLALGVAPTRVAADEVEASGRPVTVKVLLSSRSEACYDPGDVGAIKRLARIEQQRVNESGGIAGRKLHVDFLDDQRDDQRAVGNVHSAFSDPDTIAVIGLSNPKHAKAAFDSLAREINDTKIPFLSDISINSLFAKFPNVYTTRPSQDDERLPVLIQFVRQSGAAKTAFVGLKDNLFSTSLAEGLKRPASGTTLVADHRLTLKDDKLDPAEVAAAIANLKQQNPDLIYFSLGGNRLGGVLKELIAAKVTPPLFIGSRIDAIPPEIAHAYPSDIYQIAWEDLPGVYNDRVRRMISAASPMKWVFEGDRNSQAPGWNSGECKPRPDDYEPDPLSTENLRAIRVGGQYADMIGLIAAAARSASLPTDIGQLRTHILEQLQTTYATGRGTFKGRFDDWSFRPQTRAAARTPFILRLVHSLGVTQLAPTQFVRLRDETLRAVNTLYLDIDLIRAFNIDDNDKSFFAEFYLSIHDDGKGASIDQIDFSNAFLDPKTNDRQLTVRVLNDGGKSAAYPDDIKVYQVAGRFTFNPELANYPFDTQRFAIDLRPRRADIPFIIQPPPQELRDQSVDADGWLPKEQYVGFDEDFVPTVDARTHDQSVVPFYKTTFVWQMTRQTTDYFLRVVVPLIFILTVAYLSIFIPRGHFEAVVTIQVTALLSAVALYLALPKIDADTATLSDRIFLFIYMAVSLMIGISIARISPFIAHRPRVQNALGAVHIVVIPLLALLMASYVLHASTPV
jgi:Periplasmic binding protein